MCDLLALLQWDQRLHLNQHRQHTRSAEKSARRNYQDLRKQQLSEPLLYFWKQSTYVYVYMAAKYNFNCITCE